MKRSLFFVASLAFFACHSNGPRALVLVDAASDANEVAARAKSFEVKEHREVRVMHVPLVEEAMRIAARGDADVALVPEGTAMTDFASRHDGDVRGDVQFGAQRLMVIEINAGAHPTVDAQGAHALAEFLASK